MADRYEMLERAKQLLDKGVLSEEEYAHEKAKILNEPAGGAPPIQQGLESTASSPVSSTLAGAARPWGMDERTFCVLLHVSQFAGWLVPIAGFILPLTMWVTEKTKSELVDRHGRVVMNWVFSSIIYGVVSLILVGVLIGVPLLLALLVIEFIFALMGAVKASNGLVWSYPLSISFLPVQSDPEPPRSGSRPSELDSTTRGGTE